MVMPAAPDTREVSSPIPKVIRLRAAECARGRPISAAKLVAVRRRNRRRWLERRTAMSSMAICWFSPSPAQDALGANSEQHVSAGNTELAQSPQVKRNYRQITMPAPLIARARTCVTRRGQTDEPLNDVAGLAIDRLGIGRHVLMAPY